MGVDFGTGSGCHAHASLHDPTTGANLCSGDGAMGLSRDARHFVAGVLGEVRACAALTNPTVNSYKRLNAASTTSGATWSPNAVTWSRRVCAEIAIRTDASRRRRGVEGTIDTAFTGATALINPRLQPHGVAATR